MKTAIIIIGKLTEFKKNIFDELTRCYDLDDENTDIFIFNNTTSEINNKILEKQYICYDVVYLFSNNVIVFPIILLFFQYK